MFRLKFTQDFSKPYLIFGQLNSDIERSRKETRVYIGRHERYSALHDSNVRVVFTIMQVYGRVEKKEYLRIIIDFYLFIVIYFIIGRLGACEYNTSFLRPEKEEEENEEEVKEGVEQRRR
ncbi:hypothetical protein PoB_003853900 [Plakobranchus ocellatus]|uniref:Uncharacterized protein n=1 Tax=Plakobranchus ocellatus TaxID=259542 RepID=A0AAV4AW64_9GAST|nr:hypothetical protein PoB_003853900 [Plakobranchus ocellatus]